MSNVPVRPLTHALEQLSDDLRDHLMMGRYRRETNRRVWDEHVNHVRWSYTHECIGNRPDYTFVPTLQRDLGYIAEMRLLQTCLPLLHALTEYEQAWGKLCNLTLK